jgi:hypothetical protein
MYLLLAFGSAAAEGDRAVAGSRSATPVAPGPEPSADSAALPIRWSLPADLTCLLSSDCAIFNPAGGGAALEQPVLFSRLLPGPGELCVRRPGAFILHAEQNGELRRWRLQGPSCYYLQAHGVILYSPGRGEYDRSSPHGTMAPSSIRFAVPPLVAGTHGTRFQYILTVTGTVGLRVLEGSVDVAWLDDAGQPARRLEVGDAAFIGAQELSMHTMRVASGQEARQLFDNLEHTPLPAHRGVGDVSYDFAGFSAALITPGADRALSMARDFIDGQRGDAVTPQVLYFAWLKASTLGLQADARALAEVARRDFPSSAWTALILVSDREAPP